MSVSRLRSRAQRRRAVSVVALAAMTFVAAACGGDSGQGDGDEITITLSGPNQWNNDPASFGPAWEDLVARFEKEEPGINVETTVLPLAEFGQTLSTQLSAGTAPELVFKQVPHEPEQVHSLNEYLEQPNPYVEGNEKWLDLFNQDYFGPKSTRARNVKGDYEFIPFNLVIVGLYYNADILAEAGVEAPIETYGEFMDACEDIKDAGYVPLSMDQSHLGQGWTYNMIAPMLFHKYADELNQFGANNEPGTALQLSSKSLAKAILTGEFDPKDTPEVAESLRLLKEVFDKCATPNWSGISGGASFVGHDDFVGGRAAIAYGTNFAAPNLKEVDWEWGTMPFPTITKQDSEFATGQPAQFGAGVGGTNYMIPATTEGEKLDAAIKFLQFATSPEHGQPWLDASGGIPATNDAEAAPGLENLTSGEWFTTPVFKQTSFGPKSKAGQPRFEGFLLESKSLDDKLAEMDSDWDAWAKEKADEGGWTEDWAQG
ncbi:multiple sugar transport system substrate-binding protein [Haloactinopolyspora alba]|uniref:Multiple sugar transport system substrate-binding protein n=2 Tax=Haloactinopolyspora alba TaxID=648780 RepID=A0A2P8DGS2_9ACTN|nr:multiple sugar transport system substrate-binding protein [Haloactinopolyspora alba]